MPIIVDEVIISVEVTNQAAGGSTAQPTVGESTQEIIAECVEQVLEILRREREER